MIELVSRGTSSSSAANFRIAVNRFTQRIENDDRERQWFLQAISVLRIWKQMTDITMKNEKFKIQLKTTKGKILVPENMMEMILKK